MKSRQDDIKQAVRLGVRKIRSADIEGDLSSVLTERFQMIKSAVQFVARDVTPDEFCVAIAETFNEIDAECKALEPIARFFEEKLAKRVEQVASG